MPYTTSQLIEEFGRFSGEYGHFERVANPRSRRPDLHAFLLIDELVPGEQDLISAVENDSSSR